jgi:hypothetical protein
MEEGEAVFRALLWQEMGECLDVDYTVRDLPGRDVVKKSYLIQAADGFTTRDLISPHVIVLF